MLHLSHLGSSYIALSEYEKAKEKRNLLICYFMISYDHLLTSVHRNSLLRRSQQWCPKHSWSSCQWPPQRKRLTGMLMASQSETLRTCNTTHDMTLYASWPSLSQALTGRWRRHTAWWRKEKKFSRMVCHLSPFTLIVFQKARPLTRHQENISSASSGSAKSHKVSILSTFPGSGAGDSWANGHIAPEAMYFSKQNWMVRFNWFNWFNLQSASCIPSTGLVIWNPHWISRILSCTCIHGAGQLSQKLAPICDAKPPVYYTIGHSENWIEAFCAVLSDTSALTASGAEHGCAHCFAVRNFFWEKNFQIILICLLLSSDPSNMLHDQISPALSFLTNLLGCKSFVIPSAWHAVAWRPRVDMSKMWRESSPQNPTLWTSLPRASLVSSFSSSSSSAFTSLPLEPCDLPRKLVWKLVKSSKWLTFSLERNFEARNCSYTDCISCTSCIHSRFWAFRASLALVPALQVHVTLVGYKSTLTNKESQENGNLMKLMAWDSRDLFPFCYCQTIRFSAKTVPAQRPM